MAVFRTSRSFDVVFTGTLAFALVFGATHRTELSDRLFFWVHHPTAKSIEIAAEAGMSPFGAALLYRTDPQYVSQSIVDIHCDIERLGCLTSKNTVFVTDNSFKPKQTVVTAAHEMLHLAYQRLSLAEKDRIQPFLDQGIMQNSALINDELRSVVTADERRDEAHSLLGTEYTSIPTELKTYYMQYFTDRAKVLAAAATE